MQIIKNDKVFQPITLVIENESELKVMLAALNASNNDLRGNSMTLPFELTDEDLLVSDEMFYNLDKVANLG